MMRFLKFMGGMLILGVAAILLYYYFSIFTDSTSGLLTTTVLGTLPWTDWELAGYGIAAIAIVVAAAIYLAIKFLKGEKDDEGM